MIKVLEEKLNSHIVFLFNNPKMNDAMIDEELAFQFLDTIKELNEYDSLLVVLNTRGGNLKAGTMMARAMREKYKKISFYIPERCGSTGTFMLLMGDRLYYNPKAIITPCEPQMDTVEGDSISTSIIRNYLENESNNQLNPIDEGRYYATTHYFKDITRGIYHENREQIIDFMLHKVNSHEYPLSIEDFQTMGVTLESLEESIRKELDAIYQELKRLSEKNKNENVYNIILSRDGLLIYKRIFDQEKRKLGERYYKTIENPFLYEESDDRRREKMKTKEKTEEQERRIRLQNCKSLDEVDDYFSGLLIREHQSHRQEGSINYQDGESSVPDIDYIDAYLDTGYLDGSSDYADSDYYDLDEPPTYYDDATGIRQTRRQPKTNRKQDVLRDIRKPRPMYIDAYTDTGYWDGSSDYADSDYYDLDEPPTYYDDAVGIKKPYQKKRGAQ